MFVCEAVEVFDGVVCLLDDLKQCRGWKHGCGQWKPKGDFNKAPFGREGLNSVCRQCQSEYEKERSHNNPQRTMLISAKKRVAAALKEGIIIPFDITIDDIPTIPDLCPIPHCGVQLERVEGKRSTSPSLDKIIPAKGYSKGNLVVICLGCNAKKKDLSIEQFYSFGGYNEKLRDKHMTFAELLQRQVNRWEEGRIDG